MASSAQIERTAAEWLARREGGWSEAEQAAFRAWLEAAVAHRVAWLRLQTGWQRAARLKALAAGLPVGEVPPPGAWPELPSSPAASPLDLHHVSFGARDRPGSPSRRLPRWPAVAALLLVAVGWAGWWWFGSAPPVHYATALGETRAVTLADGSVVLLSSDSKVTVAYSRRQRRLELEQGEAFFEVAHQPNRSFSVEAQGRRVVAVGTRFSVRRETRDLRVAVVEGRVRLEDDTRRQAPPALLAAGTIAVATSDGLRMRTQSMDEVKDLLSWRDGNLVFRSTPLAEAVAEFNRYSARKLVVADPAIADIPVGGSFRWANADAFVRILEQAFGLRAERQGDETRLHGQ